VHARAPASRRPIRLLASALIVLTGLAVSAHGDARLTLPLATGSGTCRADALELSLSEIHAVSAWPGARRAAAWAGPPRAEDRVRLDRWCDTVGPPVVLPGARQDSGPDALAVVSWNVHVGGGDVAELVRSLREGRFDEGRPQTRFVLLLQEAHREGALVPPLRALGPVPARIVARLSSGAAREDILVTARRLGLWAYYVPSMRNGIGDGDGQPEDRGNAILSTEPLEALSAIELPFERQRRVVASAVVRVDRPEGPPWRIRVASVHLDAAASGRRLWIFGGGVRARQMQAVIDGLPSDLPLVLGGDLNNWWGRLEATERIARAAFPHAVPLDRRRTFVVPRRIDHLFFRSQGAERLPYRRLDTRFGSDHYPLLGSLPFPGGAPPPGRAQGR
jgi:endonuclease/exonuclease/phosphatase family metal-dependent hydrolase